MTEITSRLSTALADRYKIERPQEREMLENELTFRVITIVLFLALVVTGVPHRVRAARSGEKISRREEGLLIMILLRLFGFSAWIGLLIYMVNPRWTSP